MSREAKEATLAEKQALRKRRLGMALATYMVPLALSLLCWYLGMISQPRFFSIL